MEATTAGAAAASRVRVAVVAGVTLIALVLRFWGLEFGLPNLEARPDETQVLARTVEVARAAFDGSWAIYPHAYVYLQWLWSEGVLALQQLLGLAPPGDVASLWRSEPARLYAIGRTLSALAGTATVALVMIALQRSREGPAALVAGSLVATSLLHVRDSHALKPDVLMTFGVTASIVAGAALARRPSLARGAVAGLMVGAAAAAKYNGALAAVPVCAGAWMGARGARSWRRWLPPPLLVAGGCAAAFFVATSPKLLTNETSLATLRQVLQIVLPGWQADAAAGPLPDLASIPGPAPPAWATAWGRLGGYAYHVAFSMRYGLGWVATLVAPFALAWALLRASALGRLAAIFSIVWFAVVGFSPVMLSRYLTPMVPSLAIAIGVFAAAGVARLPARRRPLGLAVVTLALVAQPLWSSIRFDALAATTDTRVAATRWMATHLPAGARVAVVGTRFWAWGAPQLPPGLRAVRIGPRALVDPRRVDYVVAHDHPLFWSSVEPHFLQRNAGRLRELAEFSPFAPEGAIRPVFEVNDAYYLPVAGFGGVTRPGPRVTLFEVRKPGALREHRARPGESQGQEGVPKR